MHRIGTNQNEFRTPCLELARCLNQLLRSSLPVIDALKVFNLRDIHTFQDEFSRMESSEPTFDLLVDQEVLRLGAFPAHATETTNDFHQENQPPISETYNTNKTKPIPFQIQRF